MANLQDYCLADRGWGFRENCLGPRQYLRLELIDVAHHEEYFLQGYSNRQGAGRGGIQNFPTGLTLTTRRLRYGSYGTISAKNLQKNSFLPSYGEVACSDGAIAPYPSLDTNPGSCLDASRWRGHFDNLKSYDFEKWGGKCPLCPLFLRPCSDVQVFYCICIHKANI